MPCLFVCYPLWWLVGLGEFVWFLLPTIMLASLALRRMRRAPAGFVLWLGFLLAMLASVSQLERSTQLIAFSVRALQYLGATVLCLYVLNNVERLPSEKVARWVTWFWIWLVTFGLIAIVIPGVSFTAPVAAFLPAGIAENGYVGQLMNISFAEPSEFLSLPVPRPKPLFTFTNEWGGTLALLVPIVVGSLVSTQVDVPRRAIRFLMVASVVPIIFSVNRGLWLSLIAGFAYAAVRMAGRGSFRVLGALAVAGALLAAMLVVTPLGTVVTDRLDNPHSDKERSSVYSEAIAGTFESPFLGHGTPEDRGGTAPVGSHGQLWQVMFSHGFPAVGLYVGFWLTVLWRTRNTNTALGFWAHVTIFVSLFQIPFYGHLPHQLGVIMVATALATRDVARPSGGLPFRSPRPGTPTASLRRL